MNEQKKKKIYIGIIVLCMLITGFVLFSMNSGGGGVATDLPVHNNTPVTTNAGSTGGTPTRAPVADPSTVEYSAPGVFPSDNKFFTQVLNSDEYKSLTDFDRINVSSEELNRDDPFANY